MSFVVGRVSSLVSVILLFLTALILMRRAMSGKVPTIRKLPGVVAIEEAVGRATELGAPVHFAPGDSSYITGEYAPQVMAGMAVLAYVARLTASRGVPLIASLGGAGTGHELVPLVKGIIYESYLAEGKADAFKPEMVRYISSEQYVYAASVMGTIMREKVAANIMVGGWAGSALPILETGRRTGAIQIGGTGRTVMIPFFAALGDYVFIGEEIYAAAAQISGDRRHAAALLCEDLGKYASIALMVIGAILTTLNQPLIANVLRT